VAFCEPVLPFVHAAEFHRNGNRPMSGNALFRLLNYLNESPTLELAHWTGFHDFHSVPYSTLALFVMRHELLRVFHELPVFRVHYFGFNHYHHRLFHLVRGNDTNSFFTKVSFHGE